MDSSLVVGFDLDQTLVDSGPRIMSCLRAALAEVDVVMDEEVAARQRGLPLDRTLVALTPPEVLAEHGVEDIAARYRAHDRLPAHQGGHPLVGPMPYARAALEALDRRGGRVVVVSAKRQEAIGRVLVWAGLDDLVDVAVGDLFGPDKATALRSAGAVVYVGDHPGDVAAAHAAEVVAVAVATGSHDAAALEAAGADVVLPDLSQLPALLEDGALLARRGAA